MEALLHEMMFEKDGSMKERISLNSFVVQDVVQLTISGTDEILHGLYLCMSRIEQKLNSYMMQQMDIMDTLNNLKVAKHLDWNRSSPSNEGLEKVLLGIQNKLDAITDVFAVLPEWIPAHTLSETVGLTPDAIRKQLQNCRFFEPEVDYRQEGRIWYINKKSIAKIRRQK